MNINWREDPALVEFVARARFNLSVLDRTDRERETQRKYRQAHGERELARKRAQRAKAKAEKAEKGA